MKPIMWSFGMQSRPMFLVGNKPDIKGAVQTAVKAGMRDAIIFGKDHTGLCMHPTEFGIEHPKIKINLTGEMTAELHKHNIRAIAYFNLGMDGEMGRRHPEWLQQHAPGVTMTTADHFADICVFDDYLHTYALPVMLEMFEKYHIDGLFLDTMDAFAYCCCPKCRAAFEKDTKRPLPLPDNEDNPDWKIYGPWQYQRATDFMNYLRGKILEKYPDAEIIFNHVGGPGVPYALPGVETGIVSCDPPAFYPWVTLYANYLSTLNYGGDVFIERFARGWGDRCDLEDRTLRYKCAAIFAHRARFCVGDRMHPEARLADGSAHAMNVIYNVWKQFDRALPDRLVRNADYLYLLPESHRCGTAKEKYASPFRNADYQAPLIGPLRFLIDSGSSFQAAPEFALKRNLSQKKAVIVSGASSLTDESDALLKEFVEQGGTVFFAGQLPVLKNGQLPEYCGILSAKESLHNCVYLPGRVTGGRILVRGTIWDLTLGENAKPLMYGYPQQYSEEIKDSPYPYYNACDDTELDIPLLTVNRYGKGRVYFLNCGLLTDYYDTALPAQMEWGRDLLQRIIHKPEVRLESESGDVELVTYDDPEGGCVCVLVNHGGRENSLKYQFVTEHISSPQPAYKVKLFIRTDAHETIVAKCGRETLPVVQRGKSAIVSVVLDSTWKFIKVQRKRTRKS